MQASTHSTNARFSRAPRVDFPRRSIAALIMHHSLRFVSRRGFRSLLAAALGLCFLPLVARADWPDFRGPWGTGHVSPPGAKPLGLPLHWSETNNVTWKTALPLKGISTPIILGDQVWLT